MPNTLQAYDVSRRARYIIAYARLPQVSLVPSAERLYPSPAFILPNTPTLSRRSLAVSCWEHLHNPSVSRGTETLAHISKIPLKQRGATETKRLSF